MEQEDQERTIIWDQEKFTLGNWRENSEGQRDRNKQKERNTSIRGEMINEMQQD